MDPGEVAARERLEALFHASDRLTLHGRERMGFRLGRDEEGTAENRVGIADTLAERDG